ncbi:MAG TPA: hypothetical protein VH479_00210 [Acidimicrobiales bacterium]
MIGPGLGAGGVVHDDGDPQRELSYGLALATAAEPVTLPISSEEVRLIASKGYPLWEPVEVMQLRNRRITLAYSDLSVRLADALAFGGHRRQANWCTFSTWSSKTIGGWIEDDPELDPLDPDWLPGWVTERLTDALRWALTRDNGATYRALVAGNRYVFLEIGLAFALFLEAFDPRRLTGADEEAWTRYWRRMEAVLAEQARLDPSWMLTENPPATELELGLRQYFEALFTADPKERAERVLAGNLLIGAYEQRRVDGYVSASLALFTRPAMRRLVCRRFERAWSWRTVPSSLYASLMSHFMVLKLPDEVLTLGRPLPAPAPPGTPLFPKDLQAVTEPLTQALLTRYDLSDGRDEGRRVRNWSDYDDRMSYIANLFRSRQQHEPLFSKPFPPDVEAKLLRGELAPGATTAVPPGDPIPPAEL